MKKFENIFPFFCEDDPLDTNTLLNSLDIPENDYEKNGDFDYLLKKGYIECDPKIKYWKFKFVGVIACKKKTICVLPKYYYNKDINGPSKPNFFNDFKQILRVLKKFEKENEIGDYDPNNKDLVGSEFLLADSIIRDYIQSGIYSKERSELILNGEGETNWEATVSILDPVFSKGRPIYADVISSNTFIEEEYIITQIHKYVVNYCINRYGELLDYALISDIDSVDQLTEIGEDDFLINTIRKELNEVFVDRNIRLLNMLKSFVEKITYSTEDGLKLFGTNAFHVIWEKTCSASFNNKIKIEFIENVITNLNVSDRLLFKKQTLMDIIPKPRWWSKKEDDCIRISSTLIPDIVSIINPSDLDAKGIDQRTFFVLDPKYYNLEVEYKNREDENGYACIDVKNNPGVTDITKQILYEHVYQDKLKNYFNKLYNILLFPKLDIPEVKGNSFYNIIGHVKFNLNIFKENTVWLVALDPRDIYKSYLNNDHKGEESLKGIATEIDRIP